MIESHSKRPTKKADLKNFFFVENDLALSLRKISRNSHTIESQNLLIPNSNQVNPLWLPTSFISTSAFHRVLGIQLDDHDKIKREKLTQKNKEKPQKSWFMEGLIKPKVLRRQTFNKDSTVVLGEYSHKDKAFDGRAMVITRTEN